MFLIERRPDCAFLTHLLTVALALSPMSLIGQDLAGARGGRSTPITYNNRIRITQGRGVNGDLAPIVRIVSPLADSGIAPGDSKPGAGSANGTGFLVNLEVVTRDLVPLRLRESNVAPAGAGIRHVDLLNQGAINPDVPGLYVFFDCDLVTPDGNILPKFNNFASAFNVAGTDDTPGEGVTAWLGWHVLESVPSDVNEFTLTAALVDEAGRVGMDQIRLKVDRTKTSGQALTPAPLGSTATTGMEGDPQAPEVSIIAPRVPTAVAIGPQDKNPTLANGALIFLHVSAVARGGAEIAVSENGQREGFQNPLPVGLILDGSQIPVGAMGGSGLPNRNYPGLYVALDVPLKQPNGNVVPPGVNLAPLFDVAGSEVDALGRVRVTADWVIGGSLVVPTGKQDVTITAKVTDSMGRTGVANRVVTISKSQSGQDLTANPR
ncbi:hypothetical protein [uncultured Paludibaculum sp.]|uniref:hypothetical protein n=1 Tax=uncultured Paludibaculum sp. TaxID=1765020 RepID=UPI002AAB5502|nr:hypothetical protein [uncultured Paludibaculum sp.]